MEYGLNCGVNQVGQQGAGFTYINLDDVIGESGVVTWVSIRLGITTYYGTGTVDVQVGDLIGACVSGGIGYVKIFRDDGSNYSFIGEINTGQVSGSTLGEVQTGTLYSVRRSGNITSDTPKSSWSNITDRIIASVSTSGAVKCNVYVKLAGSDGNDGDSWGNAKRNIKEGLNVVGVGGILHVGFEDYSNQPGIKFTKNLTLKCETVGGSGGTGTTVLPKAAWQQGSYGGDEIIDRSNTNEGAFNDVLCGLGAEADEITIYNAKGQRFLPSHRALEKITLKLKRLLDNDLYVEIRNDSGSGAPQGTPQDANKIASVAVPYSSISALALSEVTITFNQDLGDTNPKWIVICLNAYNPSSTNTNVSYEIAADSAGSATEYFANKCGNSNWLIYTASNLYFKTYRGI